MVPLEVTRSGSYRVEPIELTASAVKAIKIKPPFGDPCFVEYRQPIGFDRLDPQFLQFVGVFTKEPCSISARRRQARRFRLW